MRNTIRQTYTLVILRLVLFTGFFSLLSCGHLIQPTLKTGIVQLEKGSYQADPQHTSLLFKVNHMGLSTFAGRFNKVDASLEFDPKNMADAKLSAVISVASIDVNNRSLEENLRDRSWFNAEKYPQALFKTTSVQVLDESRARFTGLLTLHGVTDTIVLDVVFNGGGNNMLTGKYTLGFTATTSFNRSAFGVDYLIPAVADKVYLEVFSEFQKQ